MEQEKENTLQQIAENALKKSIVCLNVETKTPCLASRPKFDLVKIETNNGSGFFIDKHLIVTNFHVIVGATSVNIKLSDTEKSPKIEGVAAYDEKKDLIILKISSEGHPLTLGDSDTIQNDDKICTVGYPNSIAKIEHGTIESIRKRSSGDLIRLSTKAPGGSSGSPVINTNGEVIGVESSVGIDDSGNIVCSYAIPSNRLKELLREGTESVPFEEWQEIPHVRYLAEIDAADKFQKDGYPKEAIAHYDIAIELVPDKQETYTRRADAKFEFGYLAEAITDHIIFHRFNFASYNFSNFWESISYRLDILKLYGMRFLFQIASLLGRRFWLSGNANSHIRKAKSATEQGKHKDVRRYFQIAINLYSEAIDIKEETGITYNKRGWVRYLLGQFESKHGNMEEAEYCYKFAIDDVDAALKFNPKLSRVRAAFYHTRGAAKAGLGDHNAAIEDFNECIRLKPKKKKSLYYQDRGLSKQALGQHEAAEADFAKAKEIDPDVENKSWD